MHSIKPVSFWFHLFCISSAILVALAAPTDHSRTNFASNHTHHETGDSSCAARDRRSSGLDVRSLENSGCCHYKACEDNFGNRDGGTRNPDVICSIRCEETSNCTQVYLTVHVSYYYSNGSRYTQKKRGTFTFKFTFTIKISCTHLVAYCCTTEGTPVMLGTGNAACSTKEQETCNIHYFVLVMVMLQP
jgi:hypothetical protein